MSRTFQAGNDITLAFPTAVLSRVIPRHRGVNERLRRAILAREKTSPGVSKSNVGGWHSNNDFLKWDAPDIAKLRLWFAQAVKSINDFSIGPEHASGEMEISAWANVCRSGDYHQPHFHPASDWSGVYYVTTGTDGSESRVSGRIEMLDPRTGVGLLDTPGRPFTGTLQFAPAPGLMLVFPSWLMHHVRPHEGAMERICVAFNARMLTLARPNRRSWMR